MTKDKRRDELMAELHASDIRFEDYQDGRCTEAFLKSQIAEFCIAREKKMLDEIEKPLKEYDNIYSDKYGKSRKTIDAVLSTINKYKGG